MYSFFSTDAVRTSPASYNSYSIFRTGIVFDLSFIRLAEPA
jgi:hypothetical protein